MKSSTIGVPTRWASCSRPKSSTGETAKAQKSEAEEEDEEEEEEEEEDLAVFLVEELEAETVLCG